ncbi:MAG: membrane protein insertase YidC [Bacteroidales bacterium]|jgi:YidC/Oxa1 family membrane protein insertase|nr:membrane protein insertase YidC [Bacteroidales bacterium]
MDKNTIIGLLLIFSLFIGFQIYSSKQNEKQKEEKLAKEFAEAERFLADSLARTATFDSTQVKQDTTAINQAPDGQIPATVEKPNNSILPTEEADNTLFGNYTIETDMAKYTISRKGGFINRVELKTASRYTPKGDPKQPLVLFDAQQNSLSLQLMLADQTTIASKNLLFEADMDSLKLTGKEHKTLSLKVYPAKSATTDSTAQQAKDSYIEFLYSFKANDYKVDFTVHFVNMAAYLYPTTGYQMTWDADLRTVEKNYEYERNVSTVYYLDNLDKVDNLSERDNDKKDFASPIRWVSFKQQFFAAVLMADSSNFKTSTLAVEVPAKEEKSLLKNCRAELELPIQDQVNGSFAMSWYYGPNQYKILKEYDLSLERQVPLGWGFFLFQWINRFVVIPVFNWLESYGLGYGIIILILTILLKTVLFPVAYKTYLSGARMRVLKPEMDEIAARYPKQEDAMKKQQAVMALQKKAGASPLSGCLPMLLQFPILIAMFRFFPSAYELRQQPFLWAEDLSTYDSVLNLGFNIPFYGDHVSLFTLLMTVATLIYTWMNNKMMATGAGDQQKMMKIMMYIMPIMFLGMFNSFSSALTYYYLLVNIITFIQMGIFRYTINEQKVHEKIKKAMVKPVKASKWQKKMEDMMKQQQQMQKKK